MRRARVAVAALGGLMLADMVWTLHWLDTLKLAREANPILAGYAESSLLSFAAAKAGLSLIGLAVLGWHAERKAARLGVQALTLIYGLVVGYHLALFAGFHPMV